MNDLNLVTGVTGFIGGAVARALLDRGLPLRVFARSEDKAEEFRARGAEVSLGDLRDALSLKRAVQGVSTLYHIAAAFRQAKSTAHELMETNARGTERLLAAAEEAHVGRFIHGSTTGVLGGVKEGVADETTPYGPDDDYQRSKTEAEMLVLDAFRSGRMNGVGIRPGMVYGPGDLRFLKLFKSVVKGRFVMIGSGQTRTHYVYIDDLVRGFLLAGEKRAVSGGIYTVSGPKIRTLNEVVEIIAAARGRRPPRLRVPAQPVQWLGSLCEALCAPFGIEPPLYRRRVDFFVKNRCFDLSRAKNDLGYEPQVDLAEGADKTLRWYEEKGYL